MRKTLLAFCGGLLILQAAGTAAAETPKEVHVDASVLCDVASVKPGDSFTVAIVLKTAPDWHIYWRNPGDAGLPTEFNVTLPEGFKADSPAYPFPTQFNQPGNIVAYGYTGATTFLIHVTASKDAPVSENAQLKIKVSWLSCNSERCVPGGKELTLTLPVAASTVVAPANQEVFQNTRDRMPADVPPGDVVAANSAVSAGDSRASVGLRLDWKKNPPGELQAFPLALDGLELSPAKIETVHNRSTVAFPAKILPGQKLTSDHLPVLIVYKDAAGEERGFYSSMTLPATAAANGK